MQIKETTAYELTALSVWRIQRTIIGQSKLSIYNTISL